MDHRNSRDYSLTGPAASSCELHHASASTSSHSHSSPRVPSSPDPSSSSAAAHTRHSKHLSTFSTVTRTSESGYTDAASSQQQPLLHRRYSAAAHSVGTTSAECSDAAASAAQRTKPKRRKQKKKRRPGMSGADKERKPRFWGDDTNTGIRGGQRAGGGHLARSDPSSSPTSTRRKLLVSKVILEAVLGLWALYGAIRYLISYMAPESHNVALALGICSALAATFILAAESLLSNSMKRYLHEEGVSFTRLHLMQSVLQYVGCAMLVTPALVNFVLLFLWKSRENQRCHLDVDLVWPTHSGTCHPKTWGVWLGLGVLRLVLTLSLVVAYLLICRRSNRQPLLRSSTTSATLIGGVSDLGLPSETRALRHRSNMSESTYQSYTSPLSTGSGSAAPLTTPPMGIHKHSRSSSRVSRARTASTPHQQEHTDDRDSAIAAGVINASGAVAGAGLPRQPDYTHPASPPPGLNTSGDSEPSVPGTPGAIDEQQLNAFAEQFRNLVAQITRETDEGLILVTSGNSRSQLPRRRSRIMAAGRSGFHSADASGSSSSSATISPPSGSRGALSIPHPFSSAYYAEADEYTPYSPEHDGEEEASSSSEDDEADFWPSHRPSSRHAGHFASSATPTSLAQYTGLNFTDSSQPIDPQEHIRILGAYVRRMSTIESLGSRERMSIYSSTNSNTFRDYESALSGPYSTESMRERFSSLGPGANGSINGSIGGGGGGRTQSLRSVGLASLASVGLSLSTANGSVSGGSVSASGSRAPTRAPTLASTTDHSISSNEGPSRTSTMSTNRSGAAAGGSDGPSRTSTMSTNSRAPPHSGSGSASGSGSGGQVLPTPAPVHGTRSTPSPPNLPPLNLSSVQVPHPYGPTSSTSYTPSSARNSSPISPGPGGYMPSLLEDETDSPVTESPAPISAGDEFFHTGIPASATGGVGVGGMTAGREKPPPLLREKNSDSSGSYHSVTEAPASSQRGWAGSRTQP